MAEFAKITSVRLTEKRLVQLEELRRAMNLKSITQTIIACIDIATRSPGLIYTEAGYMTEAEFDEFIVSKMKLDPRYSDKMDTDAEITAWARLHAEISRKYRK